jgi:hypothetical protein
MSLDSWPTLTDARLMQAADPLRGSPTGNNCCATGEAKEGRMPLFCRWRVPCQESK